MAERDTLEPTVRQRGVTIADTDLDAFERTLKHRFLDRSLLVCAITHPSVGLASEDGVYQRLEFLGDRVLGLVIAECLYRQFPGAAEGELARRFNALVQRDMLAEVAREIGLGDYLVLGPGEMKSGGRDKSAILADACEAVIAALYLDGGFDAARKIVERIWSPHIGRQTEAPRDPKTALQEWSQAHGFGLPTYIERHRTGPAHAPQFTVEVMVPGIQPAIGEGASKREAERNAAVVMLEREAAGTDG